MAINKFFGYTVFGLIAASLLLCAPGQITSQAAEESTTTPVPRNKGKVAWWKKFESASELVKQNKDAELIFIGDSITHFWEYTREGGRIQTWNHYYGHRKALNLGDLGDQTQNTLWRLDNGNIEGLSPKVAVLLIGTNNAGLGDSAAEIAAGIKAIIEKLRIKMPQTKILVLGILPAGKPDNPRRQVANSANALVAKFADGRMVHYLDISSNFLEDNGKLRGFTTTTGQNDLVHLSGEGYRIWAKAMEPKLAELLGDKPMQPQEKE